MKKLLETPHKRISLYRTVMGRDIMIPIADGMSDQIRATITMNEENKKSKIREAAAKAAAQATAALSSKKKNPVATPAADKAKRTSAVVTTYVNQAPPTISDMAGTSVNPDLSNDDDFELLPDDV